MYETVIHAVAHIILGIINRNNHHIDTPMTKPRPRVRNLRRRGFISLYMAISASYDPRSIHRRYHRRPSLHTNRLLRAAFRHRFHSRSGNASSFRPVRPLLRATANFIAFNDHRGNVASLMLSVLMVWKLLVPLVLNGYSPLLSSIVLVVLLTIIIDLLVAGIKKTSLVGSFGLVTVAPFTALVASLIFPKSDRRLVA